MVYEIIEIVEVPKKAPSDLTSSEQNRDVSVENDAMSSRHVNGDSTK